MPVERAPNVDTCFRLCGSKIVGTRSSRQQSLLRGHLRVSVSQKELDARTTPGVSGF